MSRAYPFQGMSARRLSMVSRRTLSLPGGAAVGPAAGGATATALALGAALSEAAALARGGAEGAGRTLALAGDGGEEADVCAGSPAQAEQARTAAAASAKGGMPISMTERSLPSNADSGLQIAPGEMASAMLRLAPMPVAPPGQPRKLPPPPPLGAAAAPGASSFRSPISSGAAPPPLRPPMRTPAQGENASQAIKDQICEMALGLLEEQVQARIVHYKADLETNPELDAITAEVVAQLKEIQAQSSAAAYGAAARDAVRESHEKLLRGL